MTDPPRWPFDPDVLSAPHDFYGEWAAEGPVVEVPERNAWLITGHREAAYVLRHPGTSTSPVPTPAEIGRGDPRLGAPVHQTLSRMAVLSNGPSHRKLRLALQPAFGADVVEALRPTMRAVVGAALDAQNGFIAGDESLDAAAAFCDVVVSAVLDRACGVPDDLGPKLRAGWTRALAPVEHLEAMPAADTAALVLDLHEDLLAVMAGAQARTGTSDRPIDIFVREAGRQDLSAVDAAANLLLVLTSGHRTLRHSLGLAIHNLAIDPEQQALLRDSPQRIAAGVEELVRWDNAVPATIRVATGDITVGSNEIRAGSTIGVLLAAANRDHRFHTGGAQLDVAHPPIRHLGFGRGAHFCPGAALSRAMMTEALRELLVRTSSFHLTTPPRWLDHRRGITELRIAVA